MKAWRVISPIALLVAILGALSWGIVGIWKYDVVAEVFGDSFGITSSGARTVWVIVGIAGLVTAALFFELAARARMTGWRAVSLVSLGLTSLAAISWGIVGIWEYDVVAELFGDSFGVTSSAARTVYAIAGIAGLVSLGLLYELISGRVGMRSTGVEGARDHDHYDMPKAA